MDDRLITSLERAVAASPDDLALRLHLGSLLVEAGRADEAVQHAAEALRRTPGSAEARALMASALAPAEPSAPGVQAAGPAEAPGNDEAEERDPEAGSEDFSWTMAERQVEDIVAPMFVDGSDEAELPGAYDVQRLGVRLDDVGGLDDVKARLEASFLAPMRNPELRKLYGKSLRGGLLLYGPPGCGKTYLAKAIAGELDAAFLHVSLADILDMYIGQSERNLAELFATARAAAPCVLFLDEVDAIGIKRSMTRGSGVRGTVNQLLTELDGVTGSNEGVYVLAATNSPWDVDSALRRPGRLDRTLLVLPPDRPARETILRTHLRDRPVERIDVSALAKRTDGFSGADLAHLCESAAESALLDSAGTGTVRMIGMADFDQALREVRPSIGPWLETASNVALYANESGEYDELAAYLRRHKRRR